MLNKKINRRDFCRLVGVGILNRTMSKGVYYINEKFRLGDESINLWKYERLPVNINYINLHENESTSVEATKKVICGVFGCGKLIYPKAQGKREISFNLNGDKYAFDPNRIFTDYGIKRTLIEHGSYDDLSHKVVKGFGDKLVSYLHPNKLTVAVHNSWGGYLMKSGRVQNALALYLNSSKDPDDFFLVKQKYDFDYLRKKGYNVILENKVHDGSLSQYCGDNGMRYINVEAQSGHLEQQVEMLRVVQEIA